MFARTVVFIVSILFFYSKSFAEKDLDQKIILMTYNVENLFDHKDDLGKNDQTYLPLSQKQSDAHRLLCDAIPKKEWREQCLNWDWTDDVVKIKIDRLAKVIHSVNSGRGPDVLVLQEVENISVLRELNQALGGGFKEILIEGQDKRGIDVAMLAKLTLIDEPKLHQLSFSDFKKGKDDTRGILQANFKLPDGKSLTVFGVHFPAPFHPTAMRSRAMAGLNALKKQVNTDYQVAMGDFNITRREKQKTNLVKALISPNWLISEDIGCQKCLGSQYFRPDKSWSFLDKILFSHTLAPHLKSSEASGQWMVDSGSIQIYKGAPGQVDNKGVPFGFNLDGKKILGISDHLPVLATLIKL